MSQLKFVLGDKLPTTYDVVIAIYSVASKPGTNKTSLTIHEYALALISIWGKSFGSDHVMSLTGVKYKLNKIFTSYYNNVYSAFHRKSKKKKSQEIKQDVPRESIRQLNKKWRCNNNTLFDIGKNMAKVTGREKEFYTDQLNVRECRLSEEIDHEYERVQQEMHETIAEQKKQEEEEECFILEGENIDMVIDDATDEEFMNSTLNISASTVDKLNISTNRSGYVRLADSTVSVSVQTTPAVPDRPQLRVNKKIATDEIKSTCAKLSSACGISIEVSRKVIQIVCKNLYNHDVYLSANEQLAGECDADAQELSTTPKRVPVSSSDYENYKYVIPSARTIADYKQIQASENETAAATALYNKDPATKAIIHFDTTSRSSIDGEWPSIILKFSTTAEEFRLHPLFFAYEDREQITDLFVETFSRLAAAISVVKNAIIKPMDLWEKINALMTDAVSKNLGIADTIPAALGSNHHPHHLLCKSHTVEALDRSNLVVLSTIEKSVQQQDVFESINPSLKSFFRGKSALVEAGIEAVLSLITHNKSAKSCSQADLFDHICEREGVSKRVFLYQQRRFAKLGKAASSILEARDILSMLLDEVEGTNQLVESCRLYLSSELFITELECLSYFNHYVTFPFLHCIECCSQVDLLAILPKLYDELSNKQTDTLKKFVVSIRRMAVPTITNEVSRRIIDKMCTSAAEAIKLQCGREYGFAENADLRATDLSRLSSPELKGLPTNNCIAERDLSKFDREAIVSRCRNRKFKAKNIRNNMVLYKSKREGKVNRISRIISLILSDRETNWNTKQEVKLKERLELKLAKAQKAKDYDKKLLQDCKSWGGPCTTTDELRHALKGSDNQQLIVKTEMAYYAHTHKADRIARKELFRLNGISYEEKLENLTIILDDEENISTSTIANLPTNEDVLIKLMPTVANEPIHNTGSLLSADIINTLCVVMWLNSNSEYEWFIGYVKKIENQSYIVDHLHRVLKASHTKWKYPSTEDIQAIEKDQIINCKVEGYWDITPDSRKRMFSVTNIKTICGAFKKHLKEC